MHEEQVDVVGAQVFERLGDGCGGALWLVVGVVDLGGEENLLARDSGGVERGSNLGLVAVHLRGVDMAVPDLEGAADGVVGVLGGDCIGAETQHGDGHSHRQREGRKWGRGRGGVVG